MRRSQEAKERRGEEWRSRPFALLLVAASLSISGGTMKEYQQERDSTDFERRCPKKKINRGREDNKEKMIRLEYPLVSEERVPMTSPTASVPTLAPVPSPWPSGVM